MKLSILIPSISERSLELESLLTKLRSQIYVGGYENDVEILTIVDKRGESATGAKRNELIQMASGEYVGFIDDDDEPQRTYVERLIYATSYNPDVIPINGFMTTNGKDRVDWEMGLGFEYKAVKVNGKTIYLRFPNHISFMRKDLINDYKFKDVSYGEDYEWAKRINDDKVFKTECRILEPIYHYKFKR